MDNDTSSSEITHEQFEDELLSHMDKIDDAFLSESSHRKNEEDEVLSNITVEEKMDGAFLSMAGQREFEDELLSHMDKISESSRRECEDEVVLSNIIRQKTMDDLFSRETDWILVEEDRLRAPFPPKYCWLCEAKISVPYYTSNEGGETETIFMHQACVDLPMEMERILHPGHTLRSLRKTGGSIQVCSSCNELGHVYYNCSDCEDFVLDIDVIKLFPTHHKCHQHPLIPIHRSEDFHCDACNRVHYGISYICATCPSFRVHQDCVSQRIVKLPSHRHDLELLYSLPENHYEEPIYCQICREDIKEDTLLCAYHCARCRYFFHIYDCGSIKHFSKPDPMVLIEEEGANAESASANCDGCGLQISVPYYTTSTGIVESVFLHKFCAQLPQSVEHHLHPGHDLTLGKSKQKCDACHAPWEGFNYCCPRASCHFSIDIICALKNVLLQHKFHEHPLVCSHRKALFACRACNRDNEGPSYKCTTCRFWVHQECASLPMSRKHVGHPHVLKLTYSLEDSLQENRTQFRCHVCREKIQLHNWAYHCTGCKYYTHVHDCSDPPWSREIEDFDHNAAIAAAVHLPAVDDKSVSLASLFFMETDKDEDKELFLDPNGTCDRCAKFLAAPCNNCALCKYFLPKSHAELVDDPISLLNGYNSMLKHTKDDNCNGFGMSFSKDTLVMRVSSSVLPRYVKHEGHRHVLLTTFITKPTWCSACENNVEGYAFRCNICDFTIDTYCALLPGSIRHRYDKKHPFKLTFYTVEDVEEYVCEICEKDITTMWFFHCTECDHSIHPRCIWKLHIKFGPFIKCDGSPSYEEVTLVLTARTQHPSVCSECEQKETSECRYSLLFRASITSKKIMTHLQCKPDIKMERWPTERENLLTFLAILRSGEDRSNFPFHVRYVYESWCRKTLKGKEMHTVRSESRLSNS